MGLVWGEEPPAELEIVENGCRYGVDVRSGHKTGFYLDQRENRAAVARYARRPRGAERLFLYRRFRHRRAARRAPAGVLNIDASAAALELARANAERNGLGEDAFDARKATSSRCCAPCGPQSGAST